MEKGFVTLALGKRQYYEMASLLARSLLDVGGKISILCDDPSKVKGPFDKVIEFPNEYTFEKPYWGLAKLLMYKHLPYEGNLFIDADSLVGRAFEPQKCLDEFNCDFTASYDKASWNTFDKIPQWCPRNLKIDYEFRYPCPMALASSVMWFTRGKREDFHEMAVHWHEYLRTKESHRHYGWFNCIPDELCYEMAYASVEMENVGDLGYNKTISQNKHMKQPDIEKGIKTYSTGEFQISNLPLSNYNSHAMYLAKKYKFAFFGWKNKRDWR